MDGSIVGAGLDQVFKGLVGLVFVAFAVGIAVGYFIHPSSDIIRTNNHPSISWELKAKGQRVDTIYIYKFKD